MSEEARVLVALGLPRAAVPVVLADPECRPLIDGFMATLREAVRELNAVLDVSASPESGRLKT